MRLFAALHEGAQQGWVWLQDPTLPARSLIRIKNPDNGKVVYCEALQIDENFLDTYNQKPRFTISTPKEALVISGWYRAALGGVSTQSDVHLSIKPCNSWWGKFKASTHHPQTVVRVAAWLGLISVILGLWSAVLGAASLWAAEPNIAVERDVQKATASEVRGSSAIELGSLLEAFMVSPDTQPDWSMGAGSSTPQISWTSSGVEERPDCTLVYESCRRGTTRVLLNGREMQHLRQRLEPVPWKLFMVSNALAKFGPERVEIGPSCDTVECSFDFMSPLISAGFSLVKLCEAGPEARYTGYEVKKDRKLSYMLVSDSTGSGGTSRSLTLFIKKPTDPQILCADAERALLNFE